MTTFLLSVDEAWSRIGRMIAFLLSVGAPGSEHFFPVSFYLPCFFLSFFSKAQCRRVGLGPGAGTWPPFCSQSARPGPGSGALSPFCSLSACRARSRIGNVSGRGSLPDWDLASPLSPPRVLRRGGSVPDWERASPLLHPRESARVGLGPGRERASPFPPPRFGVRLGPELGTGLFSFTPPCRRGALSRVENGPRLSHPPHVFRRGARFRIGNGPLLFCTPVPALGSVPD